MSKETIVEFEEVKPSRKIKTEAEQKNEKKWRKSIFDVVLGSVIYSFGVVWILQLCGFFSGGVTGTSQLIVGFVGKFTNVSEIERFLGIFVALINLPLLLIGWRGVSRRFAILTVMSIAIQTVLMSLLTNFTVSPFIFFVSLGEEANNLGLVDLLRSGLNIGNNPENLVLKEMYMANMHSGTKLMYAIIGGIVTGAGAAICLKGGGSTGGMDIISNYLVMKKRIAFTKYQTIVDTTIICLSALINVENVLYTLVRLIVYLKTIQYIYKTYQTNMIQIITTKGDEIKKALLENFNHSMTIYNAIGGYTNTGKTVIEVYVNTFEVYEYLDVVKKTDPKAFVGITKIQQISGNYVQRTII